MSELENELMVARTHILALKDDWDQEGSVGYHPITFRRAEAFLYKMKAHWTKPDCEMPVPIIAPADQGSLDLGWRFENVNILVNIPADLKEPVSFSARDTFNNHISGSCSDTGFRFFWALLYLLEGVPV